MKNASYNTFWIKVKPVSVWRQILKNNFEVPTKQIANWMNTQLNIAVKYDTVLHT